MVNYAKLIVALAAITAITVLMITGSVTSGEGVPFLTLIAGYIFGNGVSLATGSPVNPVIGRQHDPAVPVD